MAEEKVKKVTGNTMVDTEAKHRQGEKAQKWKALQLEEECCGHKQLMLKKREEEKSKQRRFTELKQACLSCYSLLQEGAPGGALL